jgi:hypothetical protein
MDGLGRARAGVLAAGLISTVALFGGCSPAVPSPTPAALAVAPTVAPSRLPQTPKPTSMPVHVVPPPVVPPPSAPPARTWSSAGITLDLPEGWSDPPNVEWIAIIFALDELGDPPAGLFTMLKNAGSGAADRFVFRHPFAGPANAALEARWIPSAGRSLREIVHETASDLRGEGIEVTRSRAALRSGATPCLAWEQPVRFGSIRIRAYFFEVRGGVARLTLGTLDTSSPAIERELRRILNSVRATGS